MESLALKLLRRGDYAALATKIDGESQRVALGDWPYIIAGLTFLGRRSEAEALYRRQRVKLDALGKAYAGFFLAQAAFRYGDYQGGKEWLRDVERARTRKVGQFFLKQASGFLHYAKGEFETARREAELARELACQIGDPYFIALSADLAGHSFVQRGETSRGLQLLEQASQAARRLGNGGLVDAIRASLIIYRCRFQADEESRTALREFCGRKWKVDDYTLASALLELSSQHRWRGELAEARTCLDEASRLVLGSGNRRYKVQLLLAYAELAWCRGDEFEALAMVDGAATLIDAKTDVLLGLEVSLLEAEILKNDALAPHVKVQVGKTMHARSMRRAACLFADMSMPTMPLPGEDKLLDAREQVHKGVASLDGLAGSYPSLLHDLWNQRRGTSALIVEGSTKSVVLLKAGSVNVQMGVLTTLLRRLIEALKSGRMHSKEELISKIWGHSVYNPLRHDPALHQLLARFRRILGDEASWLKTTEDGYQLSVPVVEIQSEPSHKVREPEVSLELDDVRVRQLNVRQIQFLREGAAGAFGSEDYAARTATSEASARRDLAKLVSEGYLCRVGNARATRYFFTVGGKPWEQLDS